VQLHKFVCAGTLEEKIDEMIERKKEVAGRVAGSGETWLTGALERAIARPLRAPERRRGRMAMGRWKARSGVNRETSIHDRCREDEQDRAAQS
jgi:hypothetical protein